MALGGTLVVALLVLAAIYLPGWYHARHAGQPAAVVVDQQKPGRSGPSAGPPSPPLRRPLSPPRRRRLRSPPRRPHRPRPDGITFAPLPRCQSPASIGSARRSTGTGHRTRAAASGAASGSASGRASPAHFSARRPGRPGSCYRTPGDALRSRQCRARGTLQHLEEQQRKEGYGMRGDISASWKRLEYLLDQAEGAIKRQDLAAARRT